MDIQVNSNTINGSYQSAVGNAEGTFEVLGLIDTNEATNTVLGWMVIWFNNYADLNAVTTWSAQAQLIDGVPTIVAIWLLTAESTPGEDWHSTTVGKDVFTQTPPTAEQIHASHKRGVKKSHP